MTTACVGASQSGELPSVFLDEDGDHALHGREDATVHYDRLGPATILRDVLDLALGREMEVDLHSD